MKEMVFKEEFPKAEVHRCQVHVVRNVLAKVPIKLKQEGGGWHAVDLLCLVQREGKGIFRPVQGSLGEGCSLGG